MTYEVATPRFRPEKFADYAWQNALCDRQGHPFDGERRAYNEAVCAWDAAFALMAAENKRLLADAERYQVLRDGPFDQPRVLDVFRGPALDEFLDSAIQARAAASIGAAGGDGNG